MSKNNNSGKVAQALASPTVYVFDFKDVPVEQYAQTLNVLFRNPDFVEGVDKRNRLVKSAARLKSKTSEIGNLIRTIQQHDRKLADTLYAAIVQTNVHSDVGLDYLSFSSLLHYYVDYSRPGVSERVLQLASNLYKVTFLADMLESVVVDVKSDMQEVFGDEFQFQQFDGVLQVLKQLQGFFKSVRPQNDDTRDAQLYLDYSDSINDYLAKRLKTYVQKLNKIKPEYTGYTEEDVVKALNYYFDSDQFTSANIQHTEAGCPYIDIHSVQAIANSYQLNKVERLLKEHDKDMEKNYTTACYCFTDVVVRKYKREKK